VRKALMWRERNDRPCSAAGLHGHTTVAAFLCGFVMDCASARVPRTKQG
jgi:hypothetical protein